MTANQKIEIAKNSKYWVDKRERLISMYGEAARVGSAARMNQVSRRIQEISLFLETLGQYAVAGAGQESYIVSSLFLYECFRELTADEREQFFFVTGSEIDGRLVLDQKIEFAHAKRNAVAVVGDTTATHRTLIKLEQFGHRLLAHFHSHPGIGISSTSPSGTDRNFQQRLEDARYPCVAAIFSRDGYIRFFRLDRECNIQIHGKGVDHVRENIFRLTDIDPVNRETH